MTQILAESLVEEKRSSCKQTKLLNYKGTAIAGQQNKLLFSDTKLFQETQRVL